MIFISELIIKRIDLLKHSEYGKNSTPLEDNEDEIYHILAAIPVYNWILYDYAGTNR